MVRCCAWRQTADITLSFLRPLLTAELEGRHCLFCRPFHVQDQNQRGGRQERLGDSDILISKTKTKTRMIDFSNTETKTNTKMIMKTETI